MREIFYLNTVRAWVITILDDASSPLHEIIDVGKIRSLAQQEDIGANIPWFRQLMGIPQLFAYLIQTDTWLRKYKVEIV